MPAAAIRGPTLPPRQPQEYRTPPMNLFYQDHVLPPNRAARSAPPTGPAPPPPVMSIPLHPPIVSKISQRRVGEAVVRTNPKLRGASAGHHLNIPRHHSEESLHQARGLLFHSKIHSSADEISSMNRSDDSSSDESFSRTDFSRTDIESPSPPSRPKNKAPWMYPSDIQIDPSSLESSPKMSHYLPFPAVASSNYHNFKKPTTNGGASGSTGNHQLRLPSVGQSPSPAHHEEFKSEVESELDFDDHNPESEVAAIGGAGFGGVGAGEKLCSRLELPPGVTGVESCRSAMSSAMGGSYIGDSCGSFEFLPKDVQQRRKIRGESAATAISESPPRDIKKEIEKLAGDLAAVASNSGASKSNNLEMMIMPMNGGSVIGISENKRASDSDTRDSRNSAGSRVSGGKNDTADSVRSGGSRKSNGSDRRSSGSDRAPNRRRRRSSNNSGGNNSNNGNNIIAAVSGEREKMSSRSGSELDGESSRLLPDLSEDNNDSSDQQQVKNNCDSTTNNPGGSSENKRSADNSPRVSGDNSLTSLIPSPPRVVNADILVNMAKSIKPPPIMLEKEQKRLVQVSGSGSKASPKVRQRAQGPGPGLGGGKFVRDNHNPGFGPMPGFEREIQRIIAEQVKA